MKRFYLGQCEYKWSHVNNHMESIWVRQELGEELFCLCNTHGFNLVYSRNPSQLLPGDIYLRNDIYVDVVANECTMFVLKFPKARLLEKVK
jgi:hypothetical protein